MPINIDDNPVNTIIESGSSCNIIPEATFRKMPGLTLKCCDNRVHAYAYHNPLQVVGCCDVKMSVKEGGRVNTAKVLPCWEENSRAAGSVERWASEIVYNTDVFTKEKLREMYPQVFVGLGKLQNYQLELNTHPLVTVEKPNGDIRLCLDMREANKAIVRERNPIPTVEETVQEMGGMKVFTKLDLNMSFHQVELHPQSRDITTFAASNGLYRYKCLVFGLNTASEKSNHIIRQVVQDCPGAFNIHDDLIVGGVDDKQHDESVIAVVKKFAECGLTINFAKLKFKIRKINFMGHTMSDKDLQVTDDKIEAMAAVPEPKNAVEVKRFLGSALFSAKFIPAALQQKQNDGVYKPICNASRNLRDAETRHSQFESGNLGC